MSAAGAQSPDELQRKRVLIISTGSRLASGFAIVDQQLLKAFANIPGVRVETYAENLDLVRFSSQKYQQIFSEYLTAKYAESPPDLVIFVYVGNLRTPGRLLPQLFPNTPIIVAGLTEEDITRGQFDPLVGGLAQRLKPSATLDLILRLQPEVRRVVVVGGTAEIDRQVLQRIREAAPQFKGRLEFDFWDKRSMAELRQAVTGLPRDSVILFGRMFRDAAGQAFVSSEVAQTIAHLANVPVYVMTDANLSAAAVGGSVASIEGFGKRAGELAGSVLSGTDIKTVPFEILDDTVPIFNWPALQRWKIPESRLPSNSIVRSRPVSFWQEYRWYIAGALVVICAQTFMIVDLLAERRRRRCTEEELRQSRELMESATSAADLGLWSREIKDGDFWANASMRSLFGFATDAPIRYEDLFARVHPEDRERINSEIERTQAAGLPFEGEFRIVLPDDMQRWALARGRTLDLQTGDARRMGVVLDITEYKWAEAQLRESEERFRSMADAAPVMLWMSGMNSGCTFFNKGWLKFTGRRMEQELGEGWIEGVHEDDVKRCVKLYRDAFAARQEFTMEYRLRRYDGEYRWIVDQGVPRFGSDGTFVGYIGIAVDLTERRRAEEKFRMAVEASPSAMLMVNEHGRIVLVNAQAEQLFGYFRGELIGQKPDILVPERLRHSQSLYAPELFVNPQARTMSSGKELCARRKDGTEVAVQVGLSPLETEEGPLVLISILDVSSRKQAEEALDQERKFLRQVIDTDPNFIFAKNGEGRFTLANQAVADAYGTTVENLIGKTDADFNRNRDEVEAFRRMDLQVIKTLQERFIPEEHITDARGKVRWLQTVKRPIFENDGSAKHVLGVSTDITKRKETEVELREHRAELAHVARISIMGELAASLAHELNQPLTAILSNAQAALRFMANEPVDLEEVREILQDIVKDNSRASEVIRRMRALVKKEQLEFAALDLPSLIRDVVALVRSDAILQNVQLVLELSEPTAPVRGDRVQLQQVILNLLLNGFEAMNRRPANEREIKVTTVLQDGYVNVAVRDRGTGLSPDKMGKIFQPFFTTKGDGLGMGLSICRSIIEAHGGRLWAENNPDRGATFYFTVPVEKSERAGSA